MNIHDNLIATLSSARNFLKVNAYSELFVNEHLDKLAKNLLLFHKKIPSCFPEPHFSVECSPPIEESFFFFKQALEKFVCNSENIEHNSENFAKCLDEIPCLNLLVLLGQRLTPASITDERAIPPTQERLMSSAMEEGKQGLSVAARAWAKHVNRHPEENYWGDISGNANKKNAGVKEILLRILDNTTWWNIFFHYKHELVYEARVCSGHGVRWGKKGEIFIGFLEPFLEES